MARRFSINKRRAIYMLSDGKCENCGDPLPDGWHADHKKAWSLGGETDVINGQALCPKCNWKKGTNHMMTWDDLRPWQQVFVVAYASYMLPDYLLVCLPGGGKTRASLWAAKQWYGNAGRKPRLIVHVSPLKELKKQFRKAAKKHFGLQFQTEYDGGIKAGMCGLCFTYAGMAAAAGTLRALCSRYEILAIFDEPHHMSDEAAWGKQALVAFEHASRRLFMTGTPWREDMDGMPFIGGVEPSGKQRPDGTYIADHTFDWPLALEEKPRPIRILTFRYFDDTIQHIDSKTQEVLSIDSREFSIGIPNYREKEQQDIWLGGAIRGTSMIVGMLDSAHTKLLEVRANKPNAGGLVVCEGQKEASDIAKKLEKLTGVRPYLVVSDDDISSDTIEDFENNNGVWIVSVRKVSEGIDIPRLIVAVYLTNYKTELYFRQFVGRVARNEGTKFDGEAYIFIPKHWKLMEFARKIEEVQAIALTKLEGGGGGGGGGERTTYLDDLGAEMSGVLLPNSKSESSDVSAIDLAMSQYRHLGMTETLADCLIRDGKLPASTPAEAKPQEDKFDDISLEEQLDTLRKKVSDKVRTLAFKRGARQDDTQFKKAAYEANSSVGVRRVNDATIDQLKSMIVFLDAKIAAEASNDRTDAA